MGSWGLGGVVELPIQRLTDQTDGIGNLIQAGDPELQLAIAPAADAGHAPGDALEVVQLREGHVEAEAQPLGLGDDADDVRLGLVGDGELEHLLAQYEIQRPDAGVQQVEHRPDLGVGQLGVVVDGAAGDLAAAPQRLSSLIGNLRHRRLAREGLARWPFSRCSDASHGGGLGHDPEGFQARRQYR